MNTGTVEYRISLRTAETFHLEIDSIKMTPELQTELDRLIEFRLHWQRVLWNVFGVPAEFFTNEANRLED